MPVTSHAQHEDSSEFHQWIAPLECTRSEVVDGYTVNIILSPVECDEFLNPTNPTDPSVDPQEPTIVPGSSPTVRQSSDPTKSQETDKEPTKSQGSGGSPIDDFSGVPRASEVRGEGVFREPLFSFVGLLGGALVVTGGVLAIQVIGLSELQKGLLFAIIRRRVSSFRNRRTK